MCFSAILLDLPIYSHNEIDLISRSHLVFDRRRAKHHIQFTWDSALRRCGEASQDEGLKSGFIDQSFYVVWCWNSVAGQVTPVIDFRAWSSTHTENIPGICKHTHGNASTDAN